MKNIGAFGQYGAGNWLYAPDDGAGEGNAPAEVASNAESEDADETESLVAQVAKLKADLAKQKNALDKATKEAGDYRKQLKSKMTADEAAAEEKKALDEARDAELAEYRKKFAVAETAKKVMALGMDEIASGTVAENLYGAADAESALAEIQKYIAAREKALRLEFSKIPAPSAGNSDGPTITRSQLDALTYKDRVKFVQEHPDEYNKLMGR